MNDIIIETEGLNFSYVTSAEDGSYLYSPALKDVSLRIRRGEYIAVLGHNGSGKSTLAKLMNLVLTPSSGKLFIDGEDVSSADISEDKLFEIRKKYRCNGGGRRRIQRARRI